MTVCEWLIESSFRVSRASPAGFAQIDSPPISDATSACPRPTARAPTGTSRKSAPCVESEPCARDIAGAAHSTAATMTRWSVRTLERRCLIDEHHRNVVADRIPKLARLAIERRLAFAILERALAARADQDFEKSWCERHGWRLEGMVGSIDAVAEASKRGSVAAPVGKHLHVEIEIDRRPDERLDLAPSTRSDGLDARSAGADEDAFLTVALDMQHRPNVHRGARLPVLLYLTGDAVGHFILELFERGLADHLGREEAHVLRAEIVGVVVERMFGEDGAHAVEQAGHAVAGERGDDDGAGILREERCAAGGGERVGLVEGGDGGGPRSQVGGGAGGGGKGLGVAFERVDEVDDDVGVVERLEGSGAHGLLERVRGLEEARGVEENDLGIVVGDEPDDALASGLRLWTGDGKPLATEPVEVVGLHGVGSSGEGDGSGTRHQWKTIMCELTAKPQPVNWLGLCKGCRRRPTLPRSLNRSTIGAVGLNDRVRNGNECGPYALVASVLQQPALARRRFESRCSTMGMGSVRWIGACACAHAFRILIRSCECSAAFVFQP